MEVAAGGGGMNIPPLLMAEFGGGQDMSRFREGVWRFPFRNPSEDDEVVGLFCKFISQKAPKF